MKRIKSLDLARGFTVLLIAPIHTMMLYSSLPVRETLLGKLFAFVAEWHGAQIFMLLMGISFSFSKKHSYKSVLQKALILLAMAYALNIFKFVIPQFFGLLPKGLLSELQVQKGEYLPLFLIGDILHFAAIAFFILLLFYKYQWVALGLAIVICFVSPFCWNLHSNNYLTDYLLQLAGGQPPRVFFPLFPWLVYPLLGLFIGYCFQHTAHQKVFWWMRDVGWVLVVIGFVAEAASSGAQPSFYRTYPFDTLYHVGVVLVALICWDWIALNVKQNHFFRLLVYLSEHITQVYIIQWVLICWLLPVFGYHTLGYFSSVLCILFTGLLTLFISFFINTFFNGTSNRL